MEKAISLLVQQKTISQFLIKFGKDFNNVAKEHALSESDLITLMFDHVLSSSGLGVEENEAGRKLVATLKNTEPRVTLLGVRKQAGETILLFRQKFAARVMRYLINKQCEKSLQLLMSVEQES